VSVGRSAGVVEPGTNPERLNLRMPYVILSPRSLGEGESPALPGGRPCYGVAVWANETNLVSWHDVETPGVDLGLWEGADSGDAPGVRNERQGAEAIPETMDWKSTSQHWLIKLCRHAPFGSSGRRSRWEETKQVTNRRTGFPIRTADQRRLRLADSRPALSVLPVPW
jgi:hypothetical protein